MEVVDNNSGVIGYDGSLATSNLNSFKSDMESILTSLNSYYSELMYELKEYWASPKAVDFYNKNNPKFISIIESGRDNANSIIENTALSVAAMARATGSFFTYGSSVIVPILEVTPLVSEMEGWIGINLTKVGAARDTFNANMGKVSEAINSLNSSIAVRDTHDNVKSLYADKIATLKSEIDSATNSINEDIKQAITDQEEIIKAAKSKIEAILKETAGAINTVNA